MFDPFPFPPVPATIGAVTRIQTNREEEPRKIFFSIVELGHVAMVKSAVKRNRRKSQQEAARLQRLADAVPVMEEDEEIL